MAEKLLVQLEDSVGNIYYLHTSADVVFCEDGISVQTKLAQKIEKADIIQNATTASTTKVVSASVAKNLQDQINEQNTKLPIYSGLGTFDLSVKIPTDTGYYVLINYGQTTLRYVDGSRLEATVTLKTPYPDGSHSTFAFPFWDAKKNILSCNNQNGTKIILECIGDSYSSGKTLAASYFTIGYLPK